MVILVVRSQAINHFVRSYRLLFFKLSLLFFLLFCLLFCRRFRLVSFLVSLSKLFGNLWRKSLVCGRGVRLASLHLFLSKVVVHNTQQASLRGIAGFLIWTSLHAIWLAIYHLAEFHLRISLGMLSLKSITLDIIDVCVTFLKWNRCYFILSLNSIHRCLSFLHIHLYQASIHLIFNNWCEMPSEILAFLIDHLVLNQMILQRYLSLFCLFLRCIRVLHGHHWLGFMLFSLSWIDICRWASLSRVFY